MIVEFMISQPSHDISCLSREREVVESMLSLLSNEVLCLSHPI